MTEARKRDPSVDACRCILMFLIVLHHSAFHGYYSQTSVGIALPLLCTLFIYWHVDGFIAISGWYGIHFSFTRFFRILGVMMFYSIFSILYALIWLHKPFYVSFKIYGGWFGCTYLAFMFIAPLLNAAVEGLVHGEKKVAYTVWGIFNLGMILNWLPLRQFVGVIAWGGDAFSILTFIFIYVNARFVRMFGLLERFNRRLMVMVAMMFLCGVMACSLPNVLLAYVRGEGIVQSTWIGYTSYNAPHCVAMGMAVVLFFVKFVRLSQRLSGYVSSLSSSMFGVYLIHEASGVGRGLYRVPERWFALHTSIPPFCYVLICAIFTFCVCVLIDASRRWILGPFIRFAIRKISLIDQRVDSYVLKLLA